MSELANKLASVEREIAEERGGFALFALFLRQDAEDKWDLVVSSPSFHKDEKEELKYLAGRIRSHLDPEELLLLSRIVLIDADDGAVKEVNKSISVEHGMAEVRDSNFFGLQIKHAFIITSKEKDFVSPPAIPS
jgi:hypothetical protein